MYKVSENLLALLLTYKDSPRKWERTVKKLTKKWQKEGKIDSILTGTDVINKAIKKLHLFDTDYQSRTLVNLKKDGWVDGLKYAQGLIGKTIYLTWQVGGKHVISEQTVTDISVDVDGIKFSVISKSSKCRNLSISDFGKDWFVHRTDAIAEINRKDFAQASISRDDAFQSLIPVVR